MSSMAWVKLACGFLRDEKIHFIVKRYGHDTVVFWAGLLTECRRGVLEMPEEVFAEICVMDFQRFEELKKVFIKFGLVTQCNGSKLTIVNWGKYQFSESYERVKAHRAKRVTPGNATETPMKQSVTVEVDTEGDTDTEINTTSAALQDNAAATPVLSLPLNDGSEYPITQSQCAEWGSLFPAVDVLQEMREMRAWLLANQRKRKTRTGVLRFVTSWLSREQDRPKVPARGSHVDIYRKAKAA